MSHIRKITHDDMEAFKRLTVYAYAGKGLNREAFKKREEELAKNLQLGEEDIFLGHFEENSSLSGTIRLLTQPLNFRGKEVTSLGIATLAVDLFHKKEKTALKLIRHSLDRAREKGAAMVVLAPFHIGFYRNMGFGMGAHISQFRLKPSQFFNYGTKEGLVELSAADMAEIKEMYDRFYQQHHGMMKQSEVEIAGLLEGDQIIAGFRKDHKLQGLMVFTFKRIGEETIYGTDLLVDEMATLTPEAFPAFSTFIHCQADQVREVLLETRDPLFSQYFDDPSSDDFTTFQTRHQELYRVGAGMMYRVISMEKILEILMAKDSPEPFPPLCIELKDRLLPEQEGAYYVYQEESRLAFSRQPVEAAVVMEIDIADFSALVMGSTKLQSLLFSGKVTLSDHGCLPALESFLQAEQFPVCLSRF